MAKLLVVNDCLYTTRLLEAELSKKSEWSVFLAPHGQAALEILREETIDAVVTDFDMPGMNGLELLQVIRRDYPLVPVILVTAVGSETIAGEALRGGASNYVPLPRLRRDLLEAVNTVLEVRQARLDRKTIASRTLSCEYVVLLPNKRSVLQAFRQQVQDLALAAHVVKLENIARFGVAIEEALTNAMIHGNLEVESALRDREDGSYERLIETRLLEEPYRSRNIWSKVLMSEDVLDVTIIDEGNGFDISQLPDPMNAENLLKPHGRGLMLMRSFMDEVHFNAQGNQVTLRKFRTLDLQVSNLTERFTSHSRHDGCISLHGRPSRLHAAQSPSSP